MGFGAAFQRSLLRGRPPRGLANLLTRSLKITGVFSHRNIQVLAVMTGESGCAVSTLCLMAPGSFSCPFPPHFRRRGTQTLQAAPHCLFVIFKQIQQKLICLLGSAVAARWLGAPLQAFVVNTALAMIVSTANHQRTHDGSSGIALTSRQHDPMLSGEKVSPSCFGRSRHFLGTF